MSIKKAFPDIYSLFKCCLLVCSMASLISCASVNSNADILLSEPYNKVTFVGDADNRQADSSTPVESISVTLKGLQANILNTVPALYKKALEKSDGKPVMLSNLNMNMYSRLESFAVPYQVCTPVTRSVPGPNGTSQTYVTQTCHTHTRQQTVNVLYQTLTANLHQ